MTAEATTDRQTARGDLIALAGSSFAAGALLITGINYLVRGEMLAWIFVGCAVVSAAAAIIVGRRTLRRIP